MEFILGDSLLFLIMWLSYIFTLGDRVLYIIGVQWGQEQVKLLIF